MITNFDAKWVGNGYELPQRWNLKKDMPDLNPGVVAVRLEFRFSVQYVHLDRNKAVLMPDGGWLPCWDLHLTGFGRVIGPKDFSAAGNTPVDAAWRMVTMENRAEQLNNHL